MRNERTKRKQHTQVQVSLISTHHNKYWLVSPLPSSAPVVQLVLLLLPEEETRVRFSSQSVVDLLKALLFLGLDLKGNYLMLPHQGG
jgi:hypothetical protein